MVKSKTNNDQVFGEIDGYPEGEYFDNRLDIKEAGLHKYHVAGISRIVGIGCDSIVLNGGYVDDKDFGDEILYTGEGGRPEGSPKQTFDQELTRGNLDLSRNKASGCPIRVIRGAKHFEKQYAPASGYRYDGLYYLENYWPDVGVDGFRIWRYKLVRLNKLTLTKSNLEYNKSYNPIVRKERITNQIIRDPKIPDRLKKVYDYTCQVCGIRLEAVGVPYAEGAHIKGLGEPHNGSDSIDNMIILCPNHHHIFDAYGFSINDDFTLIGREGSLLMKSNHNINIDNIRYHREKYKLANKGAL